MASWSPPCPTALLIIDAEKHKLLDEIKMDKPRGVAFTSSGELLVLSESKLLRYSPVNKAGYKRPDAPSTLIGNLDDPQGLVVAGNGDIYVSLRGKSHQVKAFDGNGHFLRSIGKPGVPKSGPYDPLRMNNPNGLALTDDGRLWVAEEDFQPKRVSLWTAQGDFIKAFYGPTEYGGGGSSIPSTSADSTIREWSSRLTGEKEPANSVRSSTDPRSNATPARGESRNCQSISTAVST